MSGGVDSSVAALLMRRAGYECLGATMRLLGPDTAPPEGGERACCSLEDAEDARSVSYHLGMPYYVFNFTEDFRAQVLDRFAARYGAGETPNPCMDCNKYLKFGSLYRRARELDCGCMATGHYARIDREGDRWLLRKAADPGKDQSYVLCALTQEQLAFLRLPLGEIKKDRVRALAEEAGLSSARKPDSQDLCFAPDGDYAAFLERFTGRKSPPGDFVDREGNVLGRHRGLIRYTVGQRKGLGLSFPEPRYVCAKCAEDNTVVLGSREELFFRECTAEDFNCIAWDELPGEIRCKVKTRYRQREQTAFVRPEGAGRVRIRFETPLRAVECGQTAVLYDGDTVLGGGTICETRKA